MVVFSKHVIESTRASSLHLMSTVQQHLTRRQRRALIKNGRRMGCPTRPRERTSIADIYRDAGDTFFRRSFRMSFTNFKLLYKSVKTRMRAVMMEHISRPNAPNGRIKLSSRLGMAIRVFAGGDALDIHQVFGVSYCEVFRSVDIVIDAVNSCPDLSIEFPSDHNQQRKIAQHFQKDSAAGFSCCCGCIDGLLIWTHKPSAKDCEELGVGCNQFFCGRKHKYGLNLQAICDAHLRFRHISILFGACSSDTLAFELTDLKQNLDRQGFLAPGLCLFGDNAYINTSFLATPYPNVSASNDNLTKDAYNYFHSNVRIKIECAFGLLVQRWGFLRRKAPKPYSTAKTVTVVSCLCRLHNFLIDRRLEDTNTPLLPPDHTATDDFSMYLGGAAPMASIHGTEHLTAPQLTDAGNHCNDHDRRTMAREAAAVTAASNCTLPREILHALVVEQHLSRPETQPQQR